ncbi:MAG TPA: ABC transporter permease [Vicinamibacterales bacterium]|nr:ABC transporter permease [Vicinamibacterales bacterium]
MRIVASSVIARNILSEAFASLRGRRLQVALSSFGIATGIAAVVLLVAIVSGMHRYAIEQFSSVGGDIIRVTANTFERNARDPRGFPVTLQPSDMETVLRTVNHYDAALAENFGQGIIRTAKRTSQDASIRGITSQGFDVRDVHLERGRFILESEYEMGTRVAVLGADIAQDLFADEAPIGQTIFMGQWPYQVIGVLGWVGDPNAGDSSQEDRSIFIPFRACAATFRGSESAGSFYFRLKDPDNSARAITDTRAILEGLRKQRGETSGSFNIVSNIERMAEMNLVLNAIKMVVGLVGGIGLFVGAVGVANVLLVSVRERRAEIGTRRAVGATRRAIFAGFLIEALAMTMTGGVVGIAVAWGLTKIALFIPSVPAGARPHISLVTAISALAILTAVGLVAGVWPARRAAAVFPAEALRAD